MRQQGYSYQSLKPPRLHRGGLGKDLLFNIIYIIRLGDMRALAMHRASQR